MAAVAPGAWAVKEGVPASSQTKELGFVPYVPTAPEVVNLMLKMADVKSTDIVFDLGCGDGRIVVAAAKKGARAYGVDIDPDRVKEAKELVEKEGVGKRATIYLGDVFQTDFSSATVVTMYLLPKYNVRLRPKLAQVLPVGARVVSHDFDMPGWKPVDEQQITDSEGVSATVYLWKITPQIKKRAANESKKAASGAEPQKARKKEKAGAAQP
jgi:SAM-dependent methyltransferase